MKAIKLSIVYITLILCSYLIYQAGITILADISHYPVKNAIEKLTPETPLSLKKLESLEVKILHSIELRPNNAEYREYLGRLYYLQAIHYKDTASLFLEHIQLAYKSHRKASQIRPEWPYSWANMALMKSHLNQFDVGYIYSFNQAEKFGPWEVSSNIAIARAGLNGWEKLSNKMQENTVHAIERIYQQQPFQARDILKSYEFTYIACERTKDTELAESKICEQ